MDREKLLNTEQVAKSRGIPCFPEKSIMNRVNEKSRKVFLQILGSFRKDLGGSACMKCLIYSTNKFYNQFLTFLFITCLFSPIAKTSILLVEMVSVFLSTRFM